MLSNGVKMKEITDIIFETDFDELIETLEKIPLDKTVGLVVLFNEVKYEFLLNIKSDNDELLCLGPSGLPNMEMINKFKSRPVFTRHRWDFNESTLYYNDNTRYIWDGAVGSGWGMGWPVDYFLENIKNIILQITSFFKIKNEDIVFYGSSMGGFTSIQLATMIRDSYAIAENPQIDARKWMKSFYIKNGLYSSLYSPETLKDFKPYTYNVIEMMKREEYVPNLTLVHDFNDEDIQNHLIPFINELKNLPFGEQDDFNKVHIMMEPMSVHEPIPKDKLYDLLESHKCYRHRSSGNRIDYDLISRGIEIIKGLNLFDQEFYTENYPDINGCDPLTHYIFQGWKEGKDPSSDFDNDFYLDKYISVRKAGFNPLIHYAVRGINENRQINPYDQIRPLVRIIEKSEFFDEEYYVANYKNLYGLKPVEHYLIKGWKVGNNPSRKFDTKFYLLKYPDVRESGMNPLIHYLNHGMAENRIIKGVND